jgi:hypothetical protein
MGAINHFILDSDIESLKIIGRDSVEISLPATTINYQGSAVTREATITVPEGVYVDISSTKCSWTPNVAASGTYVVFGKYLDNTPYVRTIARVIVQVFRTSATQYTIRATESVQWSSTSTTVQYPAMTVTTKLTRLVPTTQQ